MRSFWIWKGLRSKAQPHSKANFFCIFSQQRVNPARFLKTLQDIFKVIYIGQEDLAGY